MAPGPRAAGAGGVDPAEVEVAQGPDRGGVGHRVDEDDPAGGDRSPAEGGDQHAGEAGADEARGVEAGGVEADRVGEVDRVDDLGHERLSRRGVEGRGRAEQEGQDVDVPDLGRARDGEEAEHRGGQRHAEVGQLEQPLLGHPVGDQPGERGEQQEGQELQAGGDPERGGAGAAGELRGRASPGRRAASRCRCWTPRRRRRSGGSWGWPGSGTWDSW